MSLYASPVSSASSDSPAIAAAVPSVRASVVIVPIVEGGKAHDGHDGAATTVAVAADDVTPVATALPETTAFAVEVAQPATNTQYDRTHHVFLTSLGLNAAAVTALVLFIVKARAYATGHSALDAVPPDALTWLCPLVMILYLWHGFVRASDLRYLHWRLGSGESPQQLRCLTPHVWMSVTCYHWSTTRSVLGCRRRKKVVTFKDKRPICFGSWIDQTHVCEHLDMHRLVKLHVCKGPIVFADEHTRVFVETQMRDFQRQHRDRDQCMDFSDGYALPLPLAKSRYLYEPGRRHPCRSQIWYMVCHCLCLGWAYRFWLERSAVRATVHISKVVSAGNHFNPVGHSSFDEETRDKMEMERAERVVTGEKVGWLAVASSVIILVAILVPLRYEEAPSGHRYG